MCVAHTEGWSEPCKYTVYDCTFGDFPAKKYRRYTAHIWLYGRPLTYLLLVALITGREPVPHLVGASEAAAAVAYHLAVQLARPRCVQSGPLGQHLPDPVRPAPH